jgi:hypothetical protein
LTCPASEIQTFINQPIPTLVGAIFSADAISLLLSEICNVYPEMK